MYLYFMSGEATNEHFTSEIKDTFNKKTFEFSFYYLQISNNLLR